jgi:hypothetical protein
MDCKHENAYKNVVSKTLTFWVCPDCGADLGSGEVPISSNELGAISSSNYEKTTPTGVKFPDNPEEGATVFTDDALYIYDGHWWYVLDDNAPDFRKLASLAKLAFKTDYRGMNKLKHQYWTDSQGVTKEYWLGSWNNINCMGKKLEQAEQLIENIYGYTTEDKVFAAIEQYWEEN